MERTRLMLERLEDRCTPSAVTTDVLYFSRPYAVVGQSVRISANISGVGTVALSGTVTFYDGGVKFAQIDVEDLSVEVAYASIYDAKLSVGDHIFTAVYSGDANHDGSASNPATETIVSSPFSPAAPPPPVAPPSPSASVQLKVATGVLTIVSNSNVTARPVGSEIEVDVQGGGTYYFVAGTVKEVVFQGSGVFTNLTNVAWLR